MSTVKAMPQEEAPCHLGPLNQASSGLNYTPSAGTSGLRHLEWLQFGWKAVVGWRRDAVGGTGPGISAHVQGREKQRQSRAPSPRAPLHAFIKSSPVTWCVVTKQLGTFHTSDPVREEGHGSLAER